MLGTEFLALLRAQVHGLAFRILKGVEVNNRDKAPRNECTCEAQFVFDICFRTVTAVDANTYCAFEYVSDILLDA